MEYRMVAIVWIVLCFMPIFGYVLHKHILAKRPLIKKTVIVSGILFLSLLLILKQLQIHFVNPTVGLTCALVAYSFWCLLTAVCREIPMRYLRWFVVSVAWLPIIFAYILCTVGVMGLFLIVDDELKVPMREATRNPDLVCVTKFWGAGAFGANGQNVVLYRKIPFLPFLEQYVYGKSVVEDGTDWKYSTCDEVLDAYD